jgi:hypothetical protein
MFSTMLEVCRRIWEDIWEAWDGGGGGGGGDEELKREVGEAEPLSQAPC